MNPSQASSASPFVNVPTWPAPRHRKLTVRSGWASHVSPLDASSQAPATRRRPEAGGAQLRRLNCNYLRGYAAGAQRSGNLGIG